MLEWNQYNPPCKSLKIWTYITHRHLQSDLKRKCICSLSGRPQRLLLSQTARHGEWISNSQRGMWKHCDKFTECIFSNLNQTSASACLSVPDCRCRNSPHQQCSPPGSHHLQLLAKHIALALVGEAHSHMVDSGSHKMQIDQPSPRS